MLLIVRNADRNLATTLRIGPDTSTVDLKLSKAATVEGSLVGSDGQPIPAGAGFLMLTIRDGNARRSINLPLVVTTGGYFRMSGIPVGCTCQVQVRVGSSYILSNESFDVEKSETVKPALPLTFNNGPQERNE